MIDEGKPVSFMSKPEPGRGPIVDIDPDQLGYIPDEVADDPNFKRFLAEELDAEVLNKRKTMHQREHAQRQAELMAEREKALADARLKGIDHLRVIADFKARGLGAPAPMGDIADVGIIDGTKAARRAAERAQQTAAEQKQKRLRAEYDREAQQIRGQTWQLAQLIGKYRNLGLKIQSQEKKDNGRKRI